MAVLVTLSILLLFPVILDSKLTYIAIRLPLQGNRAAPGAPWPLPKTWRNSTERFIFDSTKFQFISSMKSCDIFSSAFERYHKILKLEKNSIVSGPEEIVTSLNIVVKEPSCPGYPGPNMDESYNLTISANPQLTSVTAWGALRGLETFSQLIYKEVETNRLYINKTTITDEPRFNHRGIMLDTARHYLPMSILLKNLDAMAYNKFNVFHWHIVDDQSFPYESVLFPSLSEKGAYDLKLIYTQEDIKHVIEHARLRGIRVIPEFDTPGHTQSWGKAFRYLLTPCWVDGKEGVAKPNFHGAYEIFDPSRDSTFQFLKKFIGEIVRVFPDQYLHLGMDESYPACWKSSPNITAFMQENNITSYVELMQYYVTKVLDIVQNTNKSYVIWQDPIEEGTQAKPDTVVEVWRGNTTVPFQSYMSTISSKGYKTILSSCWYLNYISYGQDWKKYYECEPYNFTGTAEQYSNVIGGEACVWAEYVDGTNLLSRLWPRASAVAERLWSPRDATDVESAKFRLDQQRCRMLR
ncbi:beta-hexosaminidase subunit alpha-like [Saccostrea echinata]|uniref:beta-hexosaminidase subunit alpha-like n=1 Tax=Saccostrea echinata TaxID=191078 RepID=UPI002A8285A5|nr:beta-hexosaminidase subunit alpha-like [Saccostrea echinata]